MGRNYRKVYKLYYSNNLMGYKSLTFILLGIFLLSFVSALDVTLTPNTITEDIKQGESITKTIHYNIFNPDMTTQTATITNLNSIPFTTSSISFVSINPNSTLEGDFTLTFSPTNSNEPKLYADNIRLSYQSILTKITVTQDQIGKCKIYTLPIPLTKTLETGNTASQSIDVYVSKYCDSALQISTNQPQMPKPISFDSISGLVEPSQKFSVQVIYDSTGVQKGTYNDNIIISAMDDDENQYNLNLPITLSITGSISPITNGSFTNLPTCSLSASEFLLNQTYKLICNSINSNIEIQPIIDYDYIKGLGVSESGDSYEYSFQPIQFGNTEIKARFLFKNAPIGNEYSQEVRILAGSGVVPGTSLALRFYPELYEAEEDEPITVRAVDNKSGNILTGATIYLDGIEMVNDSLTLKSGRNYEIRASFIGYSDLVETINLNPKLIEFTINSDYNLGDSLNFTTDPEDATVSLNGNLITLPFVLNEIGTFEISVGKLGYTTSTKNITVGSQANIIYQTPLDNLKKGGEVLIEFEKNDTLIYVDFQADTSEPAEILVSEFTGKEVRFETNKVGTYHIYADGQFIHQVVIESGSKWWKSYWLWVPIGLLLIGLFIYYGFIKEDAEELPGRE